MLLGQAVLGDLAGRGTAFRRVTWTKSSYSGGNDGERVEFSRALAPTGTVPIRDSKNPDGPALVVPAASWRAFVSAAGRGEFTAL
jgi:hypothetical protein